MTAHLPVRDNRPNDELHPLIYQSLIGSCCLRGDCSVAGRMKD
jgi:hypothetical protein